MQIPPIAGMDEAGRGALAGPVVAGAVILSAPLFRRRRTIPCWSPEQRSDRTTFVIADSKLLSPDERERAFAWILESCWYGVGIVEAHIVDSLGILRATERAMQLALASLSQKLRPHALLVDGCDHFSFALPHTSIIRGDRLEPCIAAASIVAKVTRDHLMRTYHLRFPVYAFHQHKGYGTRLHRALIERHGPCALHRRTFLRKIMAGAAEHQSAVVMRSGSLRPNPNHRKSPRRNTGIVYS